VSELTGPECSGRTSVALSFLARISEADKVCAWIAEVDWQKEVEHSARVAKAMLTHLTSRFPGLFTSRDVPWYQATDDDVPR